MRPPKTADDWRVLGYEATEVFSPSAPVDESDLFAGRVPQLRKMIDGVFERGKHAVLFGERGVGKTSLAKVFHKLFPPGVKQSDRYENKQAQMMTFLRFL